MVHPSASERHGAASLIFTLSHPTPPSLHLIFTLQYLTLLPPPPHFIPQKIRPHRCTQDQFASMDGGGQVTLAGRCLGIPPREQGTRGPMYFDNRNGIDLPVIPPTACGADPPFACPLNTEGRLEVGPLDCCCWWWWCCYKAGRLSCCAFDGVVIRC